jgi:hypothetical protein
MVTVLKSGPSREQRLWSSHSSAVQVLLLDIISKSLLKSVDAVPYIVPCYKKSVGNKTRAVWKAIQRSFTEIVMNKHDSNGCC